MKRFNKPLNELSSLSNRDEQARASDLEAPPCDEDNDSVTGGTSQGQVRPNIEMTPPNGLQLQPPAQTGPFEGEEDAAMHSGPWRDTLSGQRDATNGDHTLTQIRESESSQTDLWGDAGLKMEHPGGTSRVSVLTTRAMARQSSQRPATPRTDENRPPSTQQRQIRVQGEEDQMMYNDGTINDWNRRSHRHRIDSTVQGTTVVKTQARRVDVRNDPSIRFAEPDNSRPQPRSNQGDKLCQILDRISPAEREEFFARLNEPRDSLSVHAPNRNSVYDNANSNVFTGAKSSRNAPHTPTRDITRPRSHDSRSPSPTYSYKSQTSRKGRDNFRGPNAARDHAHSSLNYRPRETTQRHTRGWQEEQYGRAGHPDGFLNESSPERSRARQGQKRQTRPQKVLLYKRDEFPDLTSKYISHSIRVFEAAAKRMNLETEEELLNNALIAFGPDKCKRFYYSKKPHTYANLKAHLMKRFKKVVWQEPCHDGTFEDVRDETEDRVRNSTTHDISKWFMIMQAAVPIRGKLRGIAHRKYEDFVSEAMVIYANHARGYYQNKVTKADSKDDKRKLSNSQQRSNKSGEKLCAVHQRYGARAWSCKGSWCSMYPAKGERPDNQAKSSQSKGVC